MLNYRDKNFVLIYQMGKVGSRTIAKSTEKLGYTVWAPHTMSGDLNEKLFKQYKNPKCLDFNGRFKLFIKRIKQKIIIRILKTRKNLKIITIVREPISRNISMYFQNIHIPLMEIAKKNDVRLPNNSNLTRLIKEFRSKFNHFHGINWFDNEFKNYFDIDVYKYDFDKKLGYGVIKKQNIEVLILKLEKLSKIGEEAIRDFLGVDKFIINNTNISDEKWYAVVYNDFKQQIVFNKDFLKDIYTSKYMKHFYTKDEISKYYARYSHRKAKIS